MPNIAISAIRSAIGTNLSAVTELKAVSRGRTANFEGFPCARYYLAGVGEQKEDMDTANNYRIYLFQIDIVMALTISGVTKQASEDEFEDAVDAVMDRIANNWNLGGVEIASIESSTVRYEETPQGVAAYLPLMVACKTLIPIS